MKPKVIEHLISIGFKEIIGEWLPVWGQGDGEYWHGKLVRDTDIVYTDRDTTFYKYSYNGIIRSEEFLMALKKETTMKTAIEWLVEEIKTLIENGYVFNPKWEQPMIEEAKKMEKQQIINTWYDCKLSIIEKNPTDADQYFNETYKKCIE